MSIHVVKHADICRISIAVDSTFSEASPLREVLSIAKDTVLFYEERCISPRNNCCGDIYIYILQQDDQCQDRRKKRLNMIGIPIIVLQLTSQKYLRLNMCVQRSACSRSIRN